MIPLPEDQVKRLFDYMEEKGLNNQQASLALMSAWAYGGIDNLKGPIFDEFIVREEEREERRRRFLHFRQDDWDFYNSCLEAIKDEHNRDVLLVVPTMPFGEYIQELLDTNEDLPLKKARRAHWEFEFPGRRCFVRMVSAASNAFRGASVDEAVFHDAVGWRAYQAIRPCVRPRRY